MTTPPTNSEPPAAMGGCDNELVVMVPESEFVSTKYWCAMCGKWGDHQSGTCPQIHSQPKQNVNEPLPASDLFRRVTEPPAWLQFTMIWVNGIIGGFGIRGLIEGDLLLMAFLPLGVAGGWVWVQIVKERMSRPNASDQATARK